MKNKKVGVIIFGVLCIVIVAICIVIQVVIKNATKQLEEEGQKYETLVTKTKGGKEVETEYTHVDDNKFYIKIPKTFKQLDYETITQKYSGDVPGVVFSDEDTTMNIAISMTDNEMKNSQINYYKNYMENILKSNGEIVASNYYEVDNHNVGQIKIITNTADTEIYNNMIYFSYNDKLVIITFNCTGELREEWQEVGDFIIDSLFFTE